MDAIYARVSGPGQTRDRTVEAQLHDGRKWASGAREFVDDGVSGFSLPLGERPAGRELMAAVRAGLVTRLWVWSVDRLGRNAEETLNTLRALHSCRVTVLENGREITIGSATGNLEGGIKAVIAQYARDVFIENSKRGKRRRFREGHWPFWQVPYGYRLDADRRLVINESEAEVVRRIAREYARGEGVPTIIDRLHADGIRPPAEHWTRTGIYRILNKSLYRGQHRFGESKGRAEEHVAATPVIIGPDLAAAVDKVDGRGVRVGDNATRLYLLRGVVQCSCGYVLTGQTSKGYLYYRCSSANHGKTCGCKIAHALTLEAEAWASLKSFLLDDVSLDAHLEELSRPAEEPASINGVTIEELEKRKAKLDWRFERDLIEPTEYEREMRAVLDLLRSARVKRPALRVNVPAVKYALDDLRVGLEAAPPELQRSMLVAFNSGSTWEHDHAVWRWALAPLLNLD